MIDLLMARDYFRLETSLKNSGSQLSEPAILYFNAHLESVFNQPEQSLSTIDLLLSMYNKSLNDTLKYHLLMAKRNNHLRQFEYKQAAETLSTLSNLVESSRKLTLDSDSRESLKESIQSYESLKNFPPQKKFQMTDSIIPFKRNEFGHMEIQVTCNGVTEDFIFDTGSTSSVISESIANRMGIQPLNAAMFINTSRGTRIKVKIGVANNLKISDLLSPFGRVKTPSFSWQL